MALRSARRGCGIWTATTLPTTTPSTTTPPACWTPTAPWWPPAGTSPCCCALAPTPWRSRPSTAPRPTISRGAVWTRARQRCWAMASPARRRWRPTLLRAATASTRPPGTACSSTRWPPPATTCRAGRCSTPTARRSRAGSMPTPTAPPCRWPMVGRCTWCLTGPATAMAAASRAACRSSLTTWPPAGRKAWRSAKPSRAPWTRQPSRAATPSRWRRPPPWCWTASTPPPVVMSTGRCKARMTSTTAAPRCRQPPNHPT